MKIVIPMSGVGQRFKNAGYHLPKPLIKVDGLPIIAHVINMFPGECDFIFICNEDHIQNPSYQMTEILKKYCPQGKILTISPHKLGPVYAVSNIYDYIDDEDEVIINYCDFTCDWNYFDFKQFLKRTKPDGCIPVYRGFHPHLLGSTNYAYVKESNRIVSDIQEKSPYTDNPMSEFASTGTYYFKTGASVKKYFKASMDQHLAVNNEYYVSMVYKPMLSDNLNVSIYEINHFMQWGTPEDLKEYNAYSKIFKNKQKQLKEKIFPGSLILPMSGLGSRFNSQGYKDIKPLIPVSGKPMYSQALNTLPQMDNQCFVIREDSDQYERLHNHIDKTYPSANILTTSSLTEGQACTCMLALNHIDLNDPLLISACDHGLFYDELEYNQLINDENVDIIVWTVRGYPHSIRNRSMYSWVKLGNASIYPNKIEKVSVKKEFLDSTNDSIILGSFTFKKGLYFKESAEILLSKNDSVNGEFYVDSCINHAIEMGLNCVSFEVDSYMCWGTPNELKCFEYWEECFHHWKYHSYSISDENIAVLD